MKNIFNKFAFFIALSFVFISCGNLATSENDDSIPQGKGKITISTDLQNGRSVLPTAITKDTEGLKWELVGTKDDEKKTIKSWTDVTDEAGTVTVTAYQSMTSDSGIVIDTGTWDFTLTASLTASQNNATEELNVLQAQCNSVQIDAGNNALNFVMQEATEKAASGSIEFTLNFPKDVVGNVEAKLFKYENNDTEISKQTLSIDSSSTDNYSSVKYSYPDTTGTTSSPLSAGYYILKIELQQNVGVATEDFRKINTYSCLIRVAPGLLSQGKYTLTDLAQLYTINYECNQGSIGNQLTPTSYNAYTSFELPEPTLVGHYFAGWYTQDYTDDGILIDEKFFGNAGETITISEDTTLYAKYVKAYEFNLSDSANNEVPDGYKVEKGIGSVTLDTPSNSVWAYYLKSNDIKFTEKNNYKITVEMKAEADTVVAIQAANADMFFTVGTEWTTCTMETGFIEKALDTSRNGISFGIGLQEITYFRNLVIESISSDDDGLPTLVFDITTEGINQYLNTQNKADKIIEVEKTTDTDNKLVYNITINAPLTNNDSVQNVKLHLRDYAKAIGVNNVSFKVSNTGDNPFATSFMADTASNNSMAWNNVRTEVVSANSCNIDFPNYIENDELTVDVITGSSVAYQNYPVKFTISEFKVEEPVVTAGPFNGKIFAIKTGETWTQEKSVEVTIPANDNKEFDVGMFNGWSSNMPSSFADVTRFFYTGDTNIKDDLIYSVNNDNPNEPKFIIANESVEDKIVKITLNEKYEVVIEDVSSIVTTWADLKYRIGNTSISEIVIKNDLTATERIYIGGRIVKIIADNDVIISRAAEGEFFIIYDGAGLELGCEEFSITLDGKNETVENKGPFIWQYHQGLGVTLTNCILQNNTLSNVDEQYERGAAIKTEQLFTMNNCSISNCHGSNGGAVYTVTNGSFTMNGGSISGCTATENGDAVYIGSGNLTLSGDAEITSDVYIANGSPVIVAGDLTKDKVATITLTSYEVDRQVITAADDNVTLADQVGKFTLKNENYKISDDGRVAQNSGSSGTVTGTPVSDFSTLKTNIANAPTDGTVTELYLTNDINMTEYLNINSGQNIVLKTNGNYSIYRDSSFTGSFFTVNSGATLTLGGSDYTITLDGRDSSLNEVSASYPFIVVKGDFTFEKKCIMQYNTNNTTSTNNIGGGIVVNSGKLTINEGIIQYCQATKGGGINVTAYAEIIVNGGKIVNNAASGNGGGIAIKSATLILDCGSEISGNKSTLSSISSSAGGGGIYANGNANITLNECIIKDNITNSAGGGVFASVATTAISENAIIQNNGCNVNLSDSCNFYGTWNDSGSTTNYNIVNGQETETLSYLYNAICINIGTLGYDKTALIPVINNEYTINGTDSTGVFKSGRNVTLSPYLIGQYEVTQELYNSVMSNNPSSFTESAATGETQNLRPVETVSWYQAIVFCNALTKQVLGENNCVYYSDAEFTKVYNETNAETSSTVYFNIAKSGYRLPTVAEWTFAAKGGDPNVSDWNYIYSGSDTIDEVAWCATNAETKTHEVGLKTSNKINIYDMTGNVSEWCWDLYRSDDEIPADTITNPTGPESGSMGWNALGGNYGHNSTSNTNYLLISKRYYTTGAIKTIGFRLCRSIIQ